MIESNEICTWKQFAKHIRSKNLKFLNQLEQFPNSILVGGCQRSGTTMLSKVIMQSNCIVTLTGKDKELDAALILCGQKQPPKGNRYCFQTTYLNDHYKEYFEYDYSQKIIWVVRNPYSVVYSLLRFSERFCLNGLFLSCGYSHMNENETSLFNKFGLLSISRIRRACYAYNSKINQIVNIMGKFDNKRLLVIDYDDLVINKNKVLAHVFEFINLPYNSKFADIVNTKSLKKSKKLSDSNIDLISSICTPYYDNIKMFCYQV